MPGPNLSPRSSIAQLAPSVAAAAAASASTSASAASGPTARPRSKKAVTRAVYSDSPFKRKSRGAIRGRSKSSTKGFAKALAKFENAMASQPRRSLSRTQSTRNVNKPKQERRPSLPNFSPESRSIKGPPKGEFMELTKGLSDKERAALFNAMALRKMRNMDKLPKQYLVDSKAVADLEKEQVKARQAMHAKVAAREHEELQRKLKEKKKILEKFEKDLNKFKKAHRAKGNKVLDIPTEINSYIKRLNELATPNMSPEGASKMTPLEIEYKKQYDKLNEHIKKLSKDYEESRKTVAVGDAVLNAERAKLSTAQSQAQRKLVEMEQERRAKAAAALEASEAAMEKRLKSERKAVAAQAKAEDLQTIMGPGKSTTFGKKRSKTGAKKTRGASKKKGGGYPSSSNKSSNFGLYP